MRCSGLFFFSFKNQFFWQTLSPQALFPFVIKLLFWMKMRFLNGNSDFLRTNVSILEVGLPWASKRSSHAVWDHDHNAHVLVHRPIWHPDRMMARESWRRQKAKAKEATRVVGYTVGGCGEGAILLKWCWSRNHFYHVSWIQPKNNFWDRSLFLSLLGT